MASSPDSAAGAPRRAAANTSPNSGSCRRLGPNHCATASAAHCGVFLSWHPLHAFGVPIFTVRSGRGTRKL